MREPAARWPRPRSTVSTSSLTTRSRARPTNAGVSAAAAATTVATCGPSSISDAKTTTKAGGMIARSALHGPCTFRLATTIAASTSADSSTMRSGCAQPARRGSSTAPMKMDTSATTVEREGIAAIQGGPSGRAKTAPTAPLGQLDSNQRNSSMEPRRAGAGMSHDGTCSTTGMCVAADYCNAIHQPGVRFGRRRRCDFCRPSNRRIPHVHRTAAV